MSHRYISVFIPTYNGEKYIRECIDAVLTQNMPEGYSLELLITDSGSSDGTVDIVKSYGEKIIFDQISNSEFGHGKTRQRAAERAKGEYILFLSQDATPAGDGWLRNLIEPFFMSDKVACVFGRQVPRSHSVPTIKREVSSVFGGLGPSDSLIFQRGVSLVDRSDVPHNTFFSDVNSAVRKDLVTTVLPFRDLKYAEDQALAQDALDAGYIKAYSPLGWVWHSNEYTAKEYYRRKFDEYIGLQESVKERLKPSKRSLLFGWVRPTLADWKFTLRDHDYNAYTKCKFFLLSSAYNFYLQLGKYRAAKYINDTQRRHAISLESQRKIH